MNVSSLPHQAWTASIVALAALVLPGCGHNPASPPAAVDVEPFKATARTTACAEVRNQLYLIDGRLVFWNRSGNCADAAYASTLFGNRADVVLADAHDSIVGPVKSYPSEPHRAMFDTIIANSDKPELGLGPGHTVTPVPF